MVQLETAEGCGYWAASFGTGFGSMLNIAIFFILLALLQTIFKIKGLFFSIFKNVFDRETGEIFLEACPNNKRDKVFA